MQTRIWVLSPKLVKIFWVVLFGTLALAHHHAQGQDPPLAKNEIKERVVQSLKNQERLLQQFRGRGILSVYTDKDQLLLNQKRAASAKAEKRLPPTYNYRGQDLAFTTLTEQYQFDFAWDHDLIQFRRDPRVQTKFDKQKLDFTPIDPDPSKPIASVYCRGPAHTFNLRYFAGKDKPELISLEPLPEKNPRRMSLSQSPEMFVLAPIQIAGTRLVALIEDKSFEIRDVIQEELNGKSLLRIDFKFDPRFLIAESDPRKLPKDHRRLFSSGSLLVEPERDFLIREVTAFSEENPSGARKSIAYAKTPGGPPVPRQIDYILGVTLYTFTVDKFDYTPTPESEFTLSAFGLPDPGGDGTTGRKTGLATPYLLGIAALLCLVLAIGFHYLSRRSAHKAIGTE